MERSRGTGAGVGGRDKDRKKAAKEISCWVESMREVRGRAGAGSGKEEKENKVDDWVGTPEWSEKLPDPAG